MPLDRSEKAAGEFNRKLGISPHPVIKPTGGLPRAITGLSGWDAIMANAPQAMSPDENLLRPLMRKYRNVDRSRVEILDLGCGKGRHSWELLHRGFSVTALDASKQALDSLRRRFEEERFFRNRIRFEQQDIKTIDLPSNSFDCIIDIESLCHVVRPPMFAIHDLLKKGGWFFSIAPRPDTWKKTLWGKGYCRLATEPELRNMLRMFSCVFIGKKSYSDGEEYEHEITSWLIKAKR